MQGSQRHPPHIYLDSTWYVVTAATYAHVPVLSPPRVKDCLRDALHQTASQFTVSLRAWVILDDHYHLLLKPSRGPDLPRFFKHLHGSTSRQINLLDGVARRRIWYNYWDTCIRNEAGFWTRFNYIHFNPVKHGYVGRPGDWEYSSFDYYRRTQGEEWLNDCVMSYPIVDTLAGDDFSRVVAKE